MDYKKRFNDILDWARSAINAGADGMLKEDLLHLMPELNESEDEKIRKAICTAICGTTAETVLEANGVKLVDALAYLEKQKEQKPNVELIQKSWYLEGYHDGKYNNEPKWLIQTGEGGPRYEENPKYGTQKPAEWSDEDRKMLDAIIERYSFPIESDFSVFVGEDKLAEMKKEFEWLRNLQYKYTWKPSKEQLEALETAQEGAIEFYTLATLYKDLKRLKGGCVL